MAVPVNEVDSVVRFIIVTILSLCTANARVEKVAEIGP